jgi:hypothetical protein
LWPLALMRELAALLWELGRLSASISSGWPWAPATCAGIDTLLAQLVRGFALDAQAHQAYVFANRRADRLNVLAYDGAGMWLCRSAETLFAPHRRVLGVSVALSEAEVHWRTFLDSLIKRGLRAVKFMAVTTMRA